MAYLWIFLFVVGVTFCAKDHYSCGPDGKCLCYTENIMDCSRTLLSIDTICKNIGNFTQQNISILNVSYNRILSIGATDLHGCETIASLLLSGNDLSEINNQSFTNFDNLTFLDISQNNLGIYSADQEMIQVVPSTLRTLMLNGNFKENTTDNVSYPDLKNLYQLKTLFVDGLNDIPFPKSYRKLRNLEHVKMSGLDGYCNMPQITNSTFNNLIYLKMLNISSCNITNIHKGAFQNLSMLRNLDLANNIQLGFRSMRNVSYDLQFTDIQTLNYSNAYTTFGIGVQLQKRDICYFWNTTLREVSLNSNRVKLMETNALLLFPKSLNILYIEDNTFTFAPYVLQLGCLANVTELYANRQNAAHKPSRYFNQPENLMPKYDLDTDDCPFMSKEFLRNISESLPDCPYFEPNKTIDFNEHYPKWPKKLKVLHLAESTLQYNVTSIFIYPTNNDVEYIDLSGNVLHSWMNPVGPFPKLKYVDLSRNYCSHMSSRATKYVASLENLQLHQNFLGLVLSDSKEGSHIFDPLINIKVLNLSSNIINHLAPNVFSNLKKLETLDLSMNNINTWTVDVNNLHNLKYLYLRFNAIRSLPADLRTKLTDNVKAHGGSFEIDLRNNTIVCTCNEKDFLQWMLLHKKSMKGFEEYIFEDESGKRLSEDNFIVKVHNLDKQCKSYVIWIVVSSIGLSVFLSISIGGFCYKNRWTLRYLLRQSKMRYFEYKALANEENYTWDAFLSFADENRAFITEKIVPFLEDKGLNLCLHDRDFKAGTNVMDNIVHAVSHSKKTIAFISDEYLESGWCKYEFHMAREETIHARDGLSCLVVVLFEQIQAIRMQDEMLVWIQQNTYIEYSKNVEDEQEQLVLQRINEAIVN